MDVFSFKPLQYFPEVVTSISVILFLLKFFPLNLHQMKGKTQKTLSPKIITKKDINNIIFVFLVIRLFNKITKLTIIYIIKKFILFLF